MLKRIFALAIATVAFGSLATASAGEPSTIVSRPVGPEVCAQQLSFESFQAACSNPATNGWQIRPPQINVTCAKRELVWVPSRTSLEMRLPTMVDIDVSFGGKQTCVDDRASYQGETVEKAICYQFEQVERSYSRTIQASCDDLAKFNSAIELCDATLKGALGGWTLVATEKTNLVMNSCTGQVETEVSIPPAKPGPQSPYGQDVQATGQGL